MRPESPNPASQNPESQHLSGLPLSRRTVLRAGGVAAAALAGAATALPALPAHAARTDIGTSALPFPLGAVRLLAGPFADNTARTHSYLNFLDPDRMLRTFRLNVGLSSSAAAVGGWESPTTQLRGHTMGHLLSALSQAYASTGIAAFKTKSDYLVAQLATCQGRASAAGYHTGYLSAFPESFIDRVEARQSVWAPYYTLHKIMAGLLDAHTLTGNAQALTVLLGMASWVKYRNDRLTYSQRQNMLDTEFGGMNEVLTNLYQLTSDPNHLSTAQYFDHAEVFDPLASGVDALNNYHANTQIPKIVGAIREYHATGTTRYRDIAVNFWDIVTHHHSYVIGGNSNGEYFHAPDRIASELSDNTCECCNSYNMLKLTRQLFFTDPDRAELMDYYERTVYNHILASQNPNSSHGLQCYYVPLRAGGIKTYSNDYNSFVCCHGTGMESNTKYGDTIYCYASDTLYVNLFIASELDWAARGITVRQETSFPQTPNTRLTITGSGAFTLKVRIPSWTSGAQLRLNSTVQSVNLTPGSYATLSRAWSSGDVVELALPMPVHSESTPDDSTVQAVTVGPIVLAGAYGSTNLSSLPSLAPASLTTTATPLRYTATASTGPVTLLPFYQLHGQRYTVYWRVTSTTPAPEFVAHYPFNESTGTTAADATGNGNTATLVGAASWVAGRSGNAVNLGGSSQHLSLPSGLLTGASACTIATWVRLDTVSTWQRIFDLGSGTNVNMFLTPRSSAGTARFAITTGGWSTEQQLDAPVALPTGVWTHVAITLGNGVGILYLNGSESARNNAMTLTPASLGTTTQNWIGRSQYSDPYLEGALDNLRIYRRVLAPAEITSLYSSGT